MSRFKQNLIIVAMLFIGFFSALIMSKYSNNNSSIIIAQDNSKISEINEYRKQLKENPNRLESFSTVSKIVMPSVVNIMASVPSRRRYLLSPFSPYQDLERQQIGSGVIVSSDGYILTNNHVVEGTKKVIVTLYDNRDFTGEVIGTDPDTDLAVVKIDAPNLIQAELGNSDELELGEWVLAFGSPFSLSSTVTAGIISALNRGGVGIASYEGFIQTDAPINPGNSGGPLVDLNGKIIGISTAILSKSGGYQGIGFAIPINRAKFVMESLLENGEVPRGYLGISTMDINRKLVRIINGKYNMNFENVQELIDFLKIDSPNGLFVYLVEDDTPAKKAGILEGDVIISLNGIQINNSSQLNDAIAELSPGTKATIEIVRNGKHITLTAELGKRPTINRRR